MINKIDKQVKELFNIVQEKKAEIAKIEKPKWITNCNFRYKKNSSESFTISTITDIDLLISILGFINTKYQEYTEAANMLGLKVEFKWLGYTASEWFTDIKTRIDKIQINQKKQELDKLETRLDALVSPEIKREMELEEITKLLKK